MATCMGSPQIAVRAAGSNKCPRHHGKEIALYCKNCDKLVCTDCVINECEDHKFGGISNLVPAAKEKLQELITNVELTEIPRMKGELQAAENDLVKNKNHFKNQIIKIRKQNEALKKELDKITETFVKTYQDMEKQNSDGLLNYMKDLQTRIDKLTTQIQEFKGTLQSGSDILVIDNSQMIRSEFEDLSRLVCSTPEFTPATFSLQELEQLLGKLDTQSQPFNLSGNWKIASTLIPLTGHRVQSIRAAARDQAWLSFQNTNTKRSIEKIMLIDQSGKIKQTLDMDVRVSDFCLSPNTGNIWFCSHQDNSVREVEGGKSTTRFTTDIPPRSICVTRDDHVIIGHRGQVVKYTQGGQEVCRTSDGDVPVMRSPWYLSECPLTSHLAVMDDDQKQHGGNYKPSVLILNDQFQPLYTYTGEVQGQRSLPKPFIPSDVCYTTTGELVVTDLNNKTVVLITGTGRYLQTLYTDSESNPKAVCVHGSAIWLSFTNQSVKVLQNN